MFGYSVIGDWILIGYWSLVIGYYSLTDYMVASINIVEAAGDAL